MISCKEYSQTWKARIKKIIDDSATKPRLDIIQIGDDPASNAYIKGKMKDCEEVGAIGVLHKYAENTTQKLLEADLETMKTSDGIIIQLPVPDHINPYKAIYEKATPNQDVDGFVYNNCMPCTPKGIISWLFENNIPVEGSSVVIIGRSDIVGKPLAREMTNLNATVTLCHSKTSREQLMHFCKNANIIVVAVGKPGWFDIDCPNACIIDVGITKGEDGKLHGDVKKGTLCTYVTPVPGGVGLLTRVALLSNLIKM